MHSPPSRTETHLKLWLQKFQKDISVLSTQLAGIMGDILALPGEDTALLTNETSPQGGLAKLDFEAGLRLHLLEETPRSSEAPLEPMVELPKISVLTFNEDVLNWAVFWEQFETAIHDSKKLHDSLKLAYLWDPMEKEQQKRSSKAWHIQQVHVPMRRQ